MDQPSLCHPLHSLYTPDGRQKTQALGEYLVHHFIRMAINGGSINKIPVGAGIFLYHVKHEWLVEWLSAYVSYGLMTGNKYI